MLRIVFAGAGEFGLPALRRLAAGHKVVEVVTQPDRPAGRGRHMEPTAIAQAALELGLPLVRTENINVEALPDADVLVVIAFGQKVSQELAGRYRLGSVNLHSSLLPKCRGAAPINWTLIRGETVTGNSVIRLAEKMDAGAILAQSRLAVEEVETAGELHDRLAEDGGNLIETVLGQLAKGMAVETPQDPALATIAAKLGRQDTLLDFAATPAGVLANRIRGLFPWPGCRVRTLDAAGAVQRRLTLVRARVVEGEGARWSAGELTLTGAISVGDGEYALEVLELQPEGKKPMAISAYRNGHPWLAGMRVESIV